MPNERVGRYGIVGGTQIGDGMFRLDALVEKPTPESAPSNLAIAARYLLTPAIFACLEQTTPGKGGEIQLTDALQLLLRREPIHGVVLRAKRHDIGNPVDWLKTNLLVRLARPGDVGRAAADGASAARRGTRRDAAARLTAQPIRRRGFVRGHGARSVTRAGGWLAVGRSVGIRVPEKILRSKISADRVLTIPEVVLSCRPDQINRRAGGGGSPPARFLLRCRESSEFGVWRSGRSGDWLSSRRSDKSPG